MFTALFLRSVMHLSLLPLDHARNSIVGIVGHAGCGHSNSHCGFIQDDSGGLCATLRILQLATDLDLTIQRSKSRSANTANSGFSPLQAASARPVRAEVLRLLRPSSHSVVSVSKLSARSLLL